MGRFIRNTAMISRIFMTNVDFSQDQICWTANSLRLNELITKFLLERKIIYEYYVKVRLVIQNSQ